MTSQDNMQTAQQNMGPQRGKMLAVCSAKGGIGRTTLTVNLAVALKKKNASVAILDGDFQFGDVNLAMDLKFSLTIKEVLEGIASIDEHSLTNYLAVHDSGVNVLTAPERPEFADLVTNEAANKIVDLLLASHDYLVVDTPVGLNEPSIRFIERADQILVVTNLEMASLKNTKLFLETLDILGLKERVRIIINRANMESVINATDAAKILAAENPINIPNDFQICSQSINLGVPFVIKHAKSDVAKGIFKMAESLTSMNSIISPKTKKNHSISKWFSKKRS
ncbi:pilus assembly protein CpaE [Bacillus sp. SORGH_AS 510]|uniref:AAA family ATPase n=1 Tax=Bacillus sp. SORGH_AS_0510 TaxID=3041771 RepID=UPI0027858B6E|nr:P-loop NTPase [Bacillus sp. SORGH_AS_0510]MDQ1147141.1 pilus assembly protein CpaE [Bacillus sp. SORGH_AS_0510]